ncbi:extracellular calcium-sensing receptor [Xenopus tropicalis]|uniref:Extracellular calcium-sensing receptor n=1 Tax=Xenopus tropicalis TaxID=8364 RepID=A0A8J0T2E4_XENTR|nr:extracellular calcium-sensing receptor [Xenopus tropicalis]|eukprot:XP_017951197.1 PREDICTED: extracellular calcium-sensing receptor-like [Xenopus tropicalis]
MVFAINEINENPELLPNITLGFRIYDSCFNEMQAVDGALQLLTGNEMAIPNYICEKKLKMVGLIGDLQSSNSVAVARILGLYRYPQISYGSALAYLSDKTSFPSFLRTAVSDKIQPYYFNMLMIYFNWTWIGILAADNDFDLYDSELLRKDIEAAGICVAFFIRISTQHTRDRTLSILQVIQKSTATVVLLYCSMPELIPFMKVATEENITGKFWISSGSVITSPIFSYKEFWRILNGTVGPKLPLTIIPGFGEFLYSIHPSLYPNDIFMKSFWEASFGCLWHNETPVNGTIYCTGQEKLNALEHQGYNEAASGYSILVYNAVYTLAHGIHNMISCRSEHPCLSRNTLDLWKILQYVKRVGVRNTAGQDLAFDENGDLISSLEYVNWQALPNGETQYVNFATEFPESHIVLSTNTIFWSGGYTEAPESICSESCPPGYRKAPQKGQPACCFDCILCSEDEFSNETDSTSCMKCTEDMWANDKHNGCWIRTLEFLSFKELLGGILATISVLGFLLPLSILAIFVKNSKTPVVKANNQNLSYLLLLSLCFCYLCALMFIGRPITITCILRQFIFGISFVMCISCVLGKTMMVVIAFNLTQPRSSRRMWLNSRVTNTLVLVCTAIQVIICAGWLAHSPPFQYTDNKSKAGTIIVECNKGSPVAYSCTMGYMGFLATLCFAIAYLGRKLPGSFNEAKLITFSMLIFGAVWISFIPAYLSTTGKYMVAVEIFAMLSSSSGLVTCIFLPKVYIIILRPEMNTKDRKICIK